MIRIDRNYKARRFSGAQLARQAWESWQVREWRSMVNSSLQCDTIDDENAVATGNRVNIIVCPVKKMTLMQPVNTSDDAVKKE